MEWVSDGPHQHIDGRADMLCEPIQLFLASHDGQSHLSGQCNHERYTARRKKRQRRMKLVLGDHVIKRFA